MKRFKRKKTSNGSYILEELNLKDLLNLNYLKYTNKTYFSGDFDLPKVYCDTKIFPDYIALYNEVLDYRKTDLTAVSFFEYDKTFDGQNGFYNVLYYGNKKAIEAYKARFKDVKFFIGPDYSLLGDLDKIENLNRIKRSRIATLWFCQELGAVSIPLITFPDLANIDCYLDGLEECKVAAISTKGHIADPVEYAILCEFAQAIATKLNLNALVVYDVCGDDEKTLKALSPIIEAGIKVILPDNKLKTRNQKLMEARHEKIK